MKDDKERDNLLRRSDILLNSYPASIKQVLIDSSPYISSRLALSLSTIVTGVILSRLGTTTSAAGSLITGITYSIIGTMRNAIRSSGMLIGELHGKVLYFEKIKHTEMSRKLKIEIGNITKGSLVFSLILSVPTIAILLTLKQSLELIGIPREIAIATQDYFTPVAYGVLPQFCLATDIQFMMGIKRKIPSFIAGFSFAALSILFGAPLSLGFWCIPRLGVEGLGYGTSIAAFFSFTGLRIYFSVKKDLREYSLFKPFSRQIFKNYAKMLKFAFSLGLQNFIEWGNLFALSILGGHLGTKTLVAENISFSFMASFNMAILALSQATSVIVSTESGKALAAFADTALSHNPKEAIIHFKNAKKLGNASLFIGLGTSLLFCSLMVGLPKQISGIFYDTSNSHTESQEETLILAQSILLMNGLGLIVDVVRNTVTGSLSGFKDVFFAPLISLLFISVIGLTSGGVFTLFLDWGADWLFITRDIGILLAAISVVVRWLKTDEDYLKKQNIPRIHNDCLNHYFPCLFKQKKILPTPINDEKENFSGRSESTISSHLQYGT